MANEQVVVEIVLDDGSIQRGWAKFSKAGDDAAKESKKSIGSIGDSLNGSALGSFTNIVKSIPTGFAVAAGAAAVAGAVIKKAFDLTIEGEKIAAINKQFDILSANAIGAGNNLKDALEAAGGGFVDTEDILLSTNKVLIDFKGNASDLPLLFETARKAAKVSNADILQTYEAINKAIATQNTRGLQNVGIFIDSKKAQEDYANSIGKNVKQLTEQEQRQAITNKLIEFSNNQLKNISLNADTATAASQKFSVQLGELGDTAAIITKGALGGLFAGATKFAADILEAFNARAIGAFGDGAERTAAQIKVLEINLADFKKSAAQNDSLGFENSFLTQRIKDTIKELENLKNIQSAIRDEEKKKAAQDSSAIPANVQAAIEASNLAAKARVEAVKKAEAEISLIQQQARQEEINNALLLLESNDLEVQRIIIAEAQAAQELIIEEQKLAAIAALRKQYADQGITDESVIQAGVLAQRALFDSKKEAAAEVFRKREKAAEEKVAAEEERKQKERLSGFSSFFGNLSALQQSGSRELFEVGKAAALAQAAIDGYAAMTGAYKIGSGIGGPPLGAAFAAAAGVAQAANIARIAATSFGSTSFDPQQTGGPDLGAPDGGIPDQPEDSRRTTNEGLVVNVQGDILGDEASGKRLVDLMNAAFDAGGVSLRRGLA